MNYYTYYTGSVLSDIDSIEPAVAAEMAKLDEFKNDRDWGNSTPIDISDVLETGETHIWENYEEDMKKISLKFPGAIIVIQGEGEERDDVWITYFKDGKAAKYMGQITFPNFNSNDLK